MSKDIPDNVTASTENATFAQAETDAFSSFMAVPVGKLDADQYVVSDLDGVTESLFGSGNMNFLMMQAGQTDEVIQSHNLFDMVGDSDGFTTMPVAGTGNSIIFGNAGTSEGFESLGGRGFDPANDATAGPDSSNGGQAGGAIGSLGASALAANTQSSTAFSSAQNFASSTTDTTTVLPPGTPTNGTNGSNGTSGNNGTNGSNGQDGEGGDTIINNETNIYVDHFLTEVVENVTDITNNITNNFTDILTTITNNVFNTINNIFGGGLGPIGLDLGTHLDDLLDLDLDIISGENIFNVINETIDLSPITVPLSDLLGDITAGLDLTAILNPFQYDDNPNDHDLTLVTGLDSLGLPLLSALDLDLNLDPIEALVGDIDINLDIAHDILPPIGGNENDTDLGLGLGSQLLDIPLINDAGNLLLNPVEDLLGDLDIALLPAIDLLGNSETDNALGDTDIVIPVDINLLNSDLLNNTLNIPLDPIEAITGDIDLDLTAAANLLGNTADGLFDAFAGGSETPNLVSDIGNVFSDLLNPFLPQTDSTDTDLALDVAGNLLGENIIDDAASVLLNPVEDLIGDIDLGIAGDLNLLDNSVTDNSAGDTDIVIPLDIAFVDSTFGADTIEINLDPIEDITGDIDLDVTLAADLLGNAAANLLDASAGGSTSANPLSDIGDVLGGVGHTLIPDAGGLLGGVDDVFEIAADQSASSTNLLDAILSPITSTLDNALTTLDNAPLNTGDLNLDVLGGNTGVIGDLVLWTENTLPDAGNVLGSGLGTDISHLIPDPIISLPNLPITVPPALHEGLLGGLGGGRHFGGLFG